MGLSLPKSNLIFLKKCLDKWVHFKIIMRSEDQRIIEEITNKAVKNALAEMEQAKPKPITTTLGYMNVTSAEIDKSS